MRRGHIVAGNEQEVEFAVLLSSLSEILDLVLEDGGAV
jgi:hypothetical protein